MRVARKAGKQSLDHSDTCESIRLEAPSKIIQTNIKLTYQKLTAIPVVSHCAHVTHLFLSHNQIASLQGIQHYPLLVSMNISYNCLTKISELRLVANPEKMDKINLRMNRFQYGYEDEVVRIFPNLRKLEGEKLGEKKMKEEMAKMRTFICEEMVQFYKKSEEIIEAMGCQTEDKENMDTNRPVKAKCSAISTQFMNNVFFMRLKDVYLHPTEELLRRKNTYSLVQFCFSLLQTLSITDIYTCKRKQQDNYMQSTRKAYRELCNTILLKFSSRNDRSLIDYLSAIRHEEEPIINTFARLGRYQDSQDAREVLKIHKPVVNASKYIKKLQKEELVNHPMNRLANWQTPQYRTLIPFEETKWHHFHNYQQKQQEQPLYEQIPIFIYCKEYLEVITDVVLSQVGKILSLEHQILQANTRCVEKQGLSDEIQLDLSNSDVMSFGQRDDPYPCQLTIPNDPHKVSQTLKIEPRSNSFLYQSKPQDLPSRATKRKEQQSIVFNLDKYSIYQINLIYKCFRSLKTIIKHRPLPA